MSESKDDPRHQLYVQIQMLIAGHPLDIAVGALADSIACGIAFGSETVEQADAAVDSIGEGLKRTIRANWDYLREVQAASDDISFGRTQ